MVGSTGAAEAVEKTRFRRSALVDGTSSCGCFSIAVAKTCFNYIQIAYIIDNIEHICISYKFPNNMKHILSLHILRVSYIILNLLKRKFIYV